MKQTYHTDIILQYKLGILPEHIVRVIPTSTLHNWKNRDINLLFGADYVSDFGDNVELIKALVSVKKLLQAAKALYFIHCTFMELFRLVKTKNKVFRESKKQIIATVNQVEYLIGKPRALRLFGIKHQQFNAWKRKIECKQLPQLDCRKRNTNQITLKEIDTIKSYLKKDAYRNWNITPVYYQMLRDKAAFFSKSSFYKYARILRLNRAKLKKKNYGVGIRCDAPKKMLHMDVTIFRPLDNTKLYLYFLVDNFSRYILNFKVSLNYSAHISFENIQEAYVTHALEEVQPGIDLITDGGSENKGEVDSFANDPKTNLRKLVAQTDITFSNSMVEAVNKRMKYDFLFTQKLINKEETEKFLTWAVQEYHNKPHSALFGLTPHEAFNGMVPDKDCYKQAINQAAKKRKEVNMNSNCLNCYSM